MKGFSAMDEENKELSAELKLKLLEVEEQAKKESRFDVSKGIPIGIISMGLFFAFGIAFKGGLLNSLIFAILGGIVGFLSGATKRPPKKQK